MGNIVLLDDLTINKIAAGEVVERPASVVKEMVENSIDAGATNITVEIKNGGISYIRITDNGKGISADDMELAFERHATSKIRNANDLDYVKSMGFRGEALASIAAIANVEMVSRTTEDEIGNRIVVEAGNVLVMEEAGCPQGTSITVHNLFFNTPVRYKFLKKDYTESGYIEDAITRLALINPNIAFKLINTGKTVIQTSGNGIIQDVIYAIYGKDIASSILEVDYQYEEIHVTGVVGKPEIARSNRANQLFFVNKRFIKDKTLTSATENSFKGLLPIGKYGFLVLNLEMDPAKVDVNVHPAKLEVRFQEENKVFKAVYHAIKDTLLKSELIANTEKEEKVIHFEDTIVPSVSQTSKPTITDLFHKIKRETEKKETDFIPKENKIEDIYKNRDKTDIKDANVKEENKVQDASSNRIDIQQMNAFHELIAMQKRLQEETLGNPSLHTNIEKIIGETEKLESQHKLPQVEQEEKSIEENMEVTVFSNTMQVEEQKENYEVQETLEKEQAIEDNLTMEQTQKIEIPMDETRVFGKEEIQEMMEKLDNMKELQDNPEFSNMYEKIFGRLPASVEEEIKEEKQKLNGFELMKEDNVSIFEQIENTQKPNYKFIGSAFNTYILIEIENALYLIDQHAAHERVMYEKVKENYDSDANKDSQMLLLPDVITLTHKEMDIFKDNNELFEKAGFVFEEFGENTIKLTGVPNICLDLDTKELFLETLDEINTVARTAKQEIEEKFIATIACKAAVKANMNLETEEVEQLMEDLLKLPNPFTCPHGRPTAIRMDKTDLEKKFARRK